MQKKLKSKGQFILSWKIKKGLERFVSSKRYSDSTMFIPKRFFFFFHEMVCVCFKQEKASWQAIESAGAQSEKLKISKF